MINFRDVLHQSEQRATDATLRAIPSQLTLQSAIATLGAPQNPTAPNHIPDATTTTLLLTNTTAIQDGYLAP